MEQLQVTIREGTHRATYEQPQLDSIEIIDGTVTLQFDPIYSDTLEATYSLEDLIDLTVKTQGD